MGNEASVPQQNGAHPEDFPISSARQKDDQFNKDNSSLPKQPSQRMGHHPGRHIPQIPKTPDMANVQRNIAQMFQRGDSGRRLGGGGGGSGPSETAPENGHHHAPRHRRSPAHSIRTHFAHEQPQTPSDPKSPFASLSLSAQQSFQHHFQRQQQKHQHRQQHRAPSHQLQQYQQRKHEQYVQQQQMHKTARQQQPHQHHQPHPQQGVYMMEQSPHQASPVGPISPRSSLPQNAVDIPVMYTTERSSRNLRVGADAFPTKTAPATETPGKPSKVPFPSMPLPTIADLSTRTEAMNLSSQNSSARIASSKAQSHPTPVQTPLAADFSATKIPSGGTDAPPKTSNLRNDEDNWKNAWDEDDESSGDENGPDEGPGPLTNSASSGVAPSAVAALSASSMLQPFRPGMDGGHSSMSPFKQPHGVGSRSSLSSSSTSQQTQYNSHQTQQDPKGSLSMNHLHNQRQLGASQQQQQLLEQQQQLLQQQPQPSTLTRTKSSSFVNHEAAVAPPQDHESEEDVLTKEADKKLKEGDNVVKWDTTSSVASVDLDEKPSVRMFFPLLRVLGKGSFGKVVLVQKRTGKERGGLFAMKILRKAHLVKRRQIERTKTERKVLSMVDHPFIMKLHFAFQTEDKLYLVLDYCPGGELFFHLSRYRRFPERVARFYAAELLLAIGHLHKKGIIYRDLKPENVLLDAEGHVKLGDFGLAKDRINHPYMGATSMCGTPEYMAPEVLGQAGHGFCVDYWGLGMLVYEMMTGLPPWYTTDRSKLFKRLKSAPLEVPSYFSHQSAKYVSALLERNPRKRLGVLGLRSVLEHEYFREINFAYLRARQIEAPIRPCEGWKPPEPTSGGGAAGSESSTIGSNGVSSFPGVGVSVPSVDPAIASAPIPDGTFASKSGQMTADALDAATANFDNTFTRMPVDTEDNVNEPHDSADEGDGCEELHENTFLGFTYDEKDKTRPQRNPRTKMISRGAALGSTGEANGQRMIDPDRQLRN